MPKQNLTELFRLCYLPTNTAWCFVFGESPIRLHNCDLFFLERRDAVAAAWSLKLDVTKTGEVHNLEQVVKPSWMRRKM